MTRRTGAPLPSLNFLLVSMLFAGLGSAMWHGWIGGRLPVFVFVVAGWVVSLCLHEFGHALVAYRGGDYGVAKTGYLDLDPLRYTDPLLSVVLPIVYIVVGGFGLPGGAVFITTERLRSRGWIAATAAAGPLANVLFLLGLALVYAGAPHDGLPDDIESGLAVLALFQATAVVLNLLPFPGLDGFGILRPYLPRDIADQADAIGGIAFLLLFLLIWLTPLGGTLLRVGLDMTQALGFGLAPTARGFQMLKLF